MERRDLSVGMIVKFGRANEAGSRATVVKLNPKRAKVQLLEHYNSWRPGTVVTVPYSCIRPEDAHYIDAPKYPAGLYVTESHDAQRPDELPPELRHREWRRLRLSDGSEVIAMV